jgi:hypothetical protein
MIKSLINYKYELIAFLSITFDKLGHDPIYLVFLSYGLLGMLVKTLKPTINIIKMNDHLEKNE